MGAKKRSAMKSFAQKATAKRGKCMALPHIEIIEPAHRKAKEDHPHLAAIGFPRLAAPRGRKFSPC